MVKNFEGIIKDIFCPSSGGKGTGLVCCYIFPSVLLILHKKLLLLVPSEKLEFACSERSYRKRPHTVVWLTLCAGCHMPKILLFLGLYIAMHCNQQCMPNTLLVVPPKLWLPMMQIIMHMLAPAQPTTSSKLAWWCCCKVSYTMVKYLLVGKQYVDCTGLVLLVVSTVSMHIKVHGHPHTSCSMHYAWPIHTCSA